jgi:hypothetical protein
MKLSNRNASDKGAVSYIVINSASDSNPPEKPSSPPIKLKRLNWRKLLLLVKDVGAVVLVVVKILQELGLL